MFWKRKENKNTLFILEADDKRLGFRVSPHKRFTADMKIKGRPIKIVNIGAGGVAFKNIDFKKSSKLSVEICLDGCKTVVLAIVCIINIDINDICHCYFSEILDRDVDAIHKYVLGVQKVEIREKKDKMKTSQISS